MNPLTQSKNATILPLLIALTLGCFVLSPQRKRCPQPGGGYPNQNTAEDDDALYSLTTGADNALASLDLGGAAGRLNTARDYHTATLLQNGMVLVAGGFDNIASGERRTVRPGEPYLDCHWQPQHRTRYVTRRRCYQTAWSLLQGDLTTLDAFRERGTLRSGERDLDCHRQPQPRTRFHTATLLPNAMVLVAGGVDSNTFLPAPNCTIRRAGPGLSRAASTRHAIFTRRRCYKTAWSLLQGDMTVSAASPTRNCTRPGEQGSGLSRAASTRHALLTPAVAVPKPQGPC